MSFAMEGKPVKRKSPEDSLDVSLPEEDQNRIIQSFMQTFGLTNHQISGYEYFMTELLPHIIRENSVLEWKSEKQNQVHRISFGEVTVLRPNIRESNGQVHNLLPQEARIRGLSYSCPVLCDVTHNVLHYDGEGQPFRSEKNVYRETVLCKIPAMVRSKFCWLYQNDSYEGTCPHDQGSYFIVNGNEKVLLSQLKLRINTPYVFSTKSPSRWEFVAEVRSCHESKWRSTSTLQIGIGKSKSGSHVPGIFVMLPFVNHGCQQLSIPMVTMFTILGFRDKSKIMDFIFQSRAPQDPRVFNIVSSSLMHIFASMDADGCKKWIGTHGTKEKTYEKKQKYVEHIIMNEFLPHCNTGDPEQTRHKKAIFLGKMIRSLVLVFLGLRKPDDRDDFKNKRCDGPGPLLAILFRQLYRNFLKSIKLSISKAVDAGKTPSILDFVNHKKITSSIRYHFSTGNWSLQRNVNTGVVQLMTRISHGAYISHIRKIATPLNREGKSILPRQLQKTDWGLCCPCETPEGQACGLLKNLSIFCHVSIGCSTEFVTQACKMVPQILDTIEISEHMRFVFVNGNPIGSVKKDEMSEAHQVLLDMKRNQDLPFDISIILEKDCLIVNSDAGRCMRPLFDLSRFSMEESVHRRTNNVKDLWKNLLMEGIITYVCKHEEEGFVVATSAKEVNSREPGYFTHMEISPISIFGITAAQQIFVDRNQAPRNMYQSAMGKQSLSIPGLNYRNRIDKNLYVLNSTMRPLVTTKISQDPRISNLPAGLSAIVAILCYGGFNQEDSILVSQASIDRGFGHVTYYKTWKEEMSTRGNEQELFEKPDESICSRGSYNYTTIDEDGFPTPGTRVRTGDVIIGKTLETNEIDKSGNPYSVKRDKSTIYNLETPGIVDQVIITTTKDGNKAVKVKIRITRIPQVGDKFSSRHGQKGTIGMVVRQEDMPFSGSGMVPDIIVNCNAIPSRMTIGQLLECLLGKLCALTGKYGDGSPFRSDKVKASVIGDELHKLGWDRHGNETLYNGKTGLPLQAKIFMGPTYYQRLKHIVVNKVHSRSTGLKTILTKQPMVGRSRNGGLRYGEMERDATIVHGAGHVLLDRMFESSDKYSVPVCRQCGLIAVPTNKRSRTVTGGRSSSAFCMNCKKKTSTMVDIPYASKIFMQEVYSMMIAPRIRV